MAAFDLFHGSEAFDGAAQDAQDAQDALADTCAEAFVGAVDPDLARQGEALDRPAARVSPTSQDGRPSLILVVEDDPLVAADLAAVLTEAGFAVLGPVSTVQAALHLVARQRPDAAVLDVRLRNELVTPVAQALQAMAVPFVVASGYSQAALQNDDLLSSVPALEKPLRPSALIDAMVSLLGETSQVGLAA